MLSIVIATYNCDDTLECTLDSLLNQTFNQYKVIFIDGKSNDGTLNIINIYKEKFENKGIEVIIISEEDKGIYDAMNKGICKVNSGYIFFLNSNDIFLSDNIFSEVSKYLKDEVNDIVYGNVLTNQIIKQNRRLDKQIIFNGICHQSAFIKKSLFDELGLYDEKFKISADYDFFVKAYSNKKIFKYIDLDIIKYDLNGFSSEKDNILKGCNEYVEIITKNLLGFERFKGISRYIYLIIKNNIKFIIERK